MSGITVPGEALTNGFSLAWTTLEEYVLSMRFLFSKSGASQVGSLVTFGSIFDAGWDWEVFWRNTAFFSLILAFMNCCRFQPWMEVMLCSCSMKWSPAGPRLRNFWSGLKPSESFLLLGLMALALGNDIWRVITGQFG